MSAGTEKRLPVRRKELGIVEHVTVTARMSGVRDTEAPKDSGWGSLCARWNASRQSQKAEGGDLERWK